MSLRQEIAKKFDDCMGYWEGINVPDHEQGHSANDYADQVLKLIEKRIDSIPLSDNYPEGHYNDIALHQIQRYTIARIKEELLK